MRNKAAYQSHWLQCSLSKRPYFNVALKTWASRDMPHVEKWPTKDAFVHERLDKACATSPWQVLFPEAQVFHMQVSYSDNDLILLNTLHTTQPRQNQEKKAPFL